MTAAELSQRWANGISIRRYQRCRRPFADTWEFVRFARAQNLDLDFTTPPRRPEPPAPETRK